MKEKERAELTHNTIKKFCDQFGEDVHAQILLEILLKGIFDEETLFVLGEQEQKTRNQGDNDFEGPGGSSVQTE